MAEEIEGLGNEQRFQMEGSLRQALIHIIKLACCPEAQATTHRSLECRAFLENATDRYRPSMRRVLDLDQLWGKAGRRVGSEASLQGVALLVFPGVVPLSLDELLDPDVDPRDLARRLAG